MKKLPLLLLPLLLAGCISRDAGKGRQAVCDSINAVWPLQVDGIELKARRDATDNISLMHNDGWY